MQYLRYAERYGWTPAQVDALPARFARWAPLLMDAIDIVREELADGDNGS